MTTQPSDFSASAPSSTIQDQLGPLAELPGTLTGKGFILISLPLSLPRDPDGSIFRLKLNAIHETLTFAPTGVIPNRGFIQLQYTQTVILEFNGVYSAYFGGNSD